MYIITVVTLRYQQRRKIKNNEMDGRLYLASRPLM